MKKGFTLIELLIVIAIIGLLASVVLVGLGGFRARGRDARRIADLRETQNALELYYTKNNAYPPIGVGTSWQSLTTSLTGATIGVITISNDPLGGTNTYEYGVAPSPYQNYVLKATLEDSGNPGLKDDVDGNIYNLDCGPSGSFPESPAYYCVQF